MLIVWILLLKILLVAVSGTVAVRRWEDPLRECELDVSGDLIALDDFELGQSCRELDRYYQCVKDRKLSRVQAGGWPEVVSNAEEVIRKVCNSKDPFHHQFLAHIRCMVREYDRSEDECRTFSKEVFAERVWFSSDLKALAKREGQLKKCILETVRVSCLSFHIESSCGSSALEVLQRFTRGSRYHLAHCADDLQSHVAEGLAGGVVHYPLPADNPGS